MNPNDTLIRIEIVIDEEMQENIFNDIEKKSLTSETKADIIEQIVLGLINSAFKEK